MHGNHDNGPGKNSDHDRRHTIEQVGGVTNHHRYGFSAELGEVDSAQKAHRNADQNRNQDYEGASHDRVGHSPAHFAGGQRQFGEEIQIHGSDTIPYQKPEDEEQHRNSEERANSSQGKHYRVEQVP